MTVVLTGATGFVGRQILRALARERCRIRLLVRQADRIHLAGYGNSIEVLQTDDLFSETEDQLEEYVAGCKLLIHAAWYTEPGAYLTSPLNIRCVEGTLRLARVFVKAGGRRFVGLGTCAEYDLSKGAVSVDTPLKPATLYAASKACTYQLLGHFFAGESVEFAWCRLFYLYGDGEDQRRLVPYIHRQLRAGKPAVLSSGAQIRDFIDVRDAAHVITQLAMSERRGVFNVCSGVPVTVREMAERVAREYNRLDLLQFGARPDGSFDPPYAVGIPNV